MEQPGMRAIAGEIRRCGVIAHYKISVFATPVTSFYIRNQDPLGTFCGINKA